MAKQFYEHLDLYGSIAYGQDGDRLLFPVGVGFRPIEEVSLTARHDGVHLHPGMTIHLFPVSIGALWIEKEDFAVTLTLGFGY